MYSLPELIEIIAEAHPLINLWLGERVVHEQDDEKPSHILLHVHVDELKSGPGLPDPDTGPRGAALVHRHTAPHLTVTHCRTRGTHNHGQFGHYENLEIEIQNLFLVRLARPN